MDVYPTGKKNNTLGGQKGENRLSEPKNRIWGPNSVWSCGILHGRAKKTILLVVKKAKKSLQSPKTEFGAQNQYGRVIYPSIENFR
jgi:hypothetical protein